MPNFYNPKVFDVTLTLKADALDSGDVMAATQEVANFFPSAEIPAFITGIQIIDEDDQGIAFDLLLMDAASDIGAEDDAAAITDAEGESILGWVNIDAGDYTDWGGFRTVTMKNTDSGFLVPGWIQGKTTSLYIGAITNGTPTYTASGVKLKISVEY